MTRSLLTAAAVLLFAAGAQAQTSAWNLDASHSHIGFTARHLGLAKVRGEFKKFSASIEADQKTGKISKLEAEAETASVTTGVQKRDDDLRSDHFFAADKFPKLKLVLKSVKWKGKAFTAVVALTMRDVTKDVKLTGQLLGIQPVNFGMGAQLRAGYEATGTVNRRDFGLAFNGLAEGISIVGDDVELNLEFEMSTIPAAAPAAATPATKPGAPAAAPGTAAAPAKPAAAAPAAKPAAAAPAAKPAAAKPAAK